MRIGILVVLSVSLLNAQEAPKIDPGSELAVSALRETAEKVKACPEVVTYENKDTKGAGAGLRIYEGPPLNVTWDVTEANSVRAPYQGYVEFRLHQRWWLPDSTLQKYNKGEAAKRFNDMLTRPKPAVEHRYEFDVGPGGLELVKSLVREVGKRDWDDYSMGASRGICWDVAVKEGQEAAEQKQKGAESERNDNH